MFGRRVYLFLISFFSMLGARADVFTVTSNADSGPGTLREALTLAAANGNSETDYIYFKLADVTEAGRTISIFTSLPLISSDVVIDASTQPGTLLSGNGTKVRLIGINNNPLESLECFTTNNIGRFEVYGFVIKNFYTSENPYSYSNGSAVNITGNAGHIIIGAAGKGNVIYDNGGNVFTQYDFGKRKIDKLEIKANYLCVKENGTEAQVKTESTVGFAYAFNVTVGGDTKAEGNVIYGSLSIEPGLPGDVLANNVSIKVKNNIIGANVLEAKDPVRSALEKPESPYYVRISVDANPHYTVTSNIDITDNVFGASVSINGFKNVTTNIQRNFFGTSSNKLNALDMRGALYLRWLEGTVLVGSDDVQNGNTFANILKGPDPIKYGESAVNVESSNKVELSHNSFYCNEGYPFLYIYTGPYDKPLEVNIDKLTSTSVNGTTKPNARVELFYTDKECTQCQPKTYIASTTANANGEWNYSAQLRPDYGVMASATLDHVSSEFTDTRIYNMGNLTITPPICDVPGKVEGLLVRNAKTLEWVNTNNEVVGTGPTLVAPPGKYRLKAVQFGCVSYSDEFDIDDQSPRVIDNHKVISQPSCGLGGSIQHLTPINSDSFAWLDSQGNIITTSRIDLYDLPAGTYTLQVKNKDCINNYSVVLTNTDGPSIDQSKTTIVASKCSNSTGSITGINAMGTNVQYSWFNNKQEEVATTRDLINQPPGIYILQITDDSKCGPVRSQPLEIPAVNDIAINISTRTVSNATCDNANGAIKNVSVSPNTPDLTYVWTNERNEVKGNLKDLTFVQAGTYILTVSGGALCQPVKSEPMVIESLNGVRLVTTGVKGKTDFCGKNTGEITGLEAPGATTFEWHKMPEDVFVSDKLDLVSVAGGNYRLYYRNATCSRFSDFRVLSGNETIYTGFVPTITMSCFALSTGSISLNTDAANEQPATYRWVNEQGRDVGFAKTVGNLPAGKYRLFLTNRNNCLYLYPGEFTVGEYLKLTVVPGKITNIRCGVGKGSISASVFSGGSGNYVYQWFDESRTLLPGETGPSISNLSVGKYHLHLQDGTCNPGDLDFEIKDESVTPTTPEANDIKVFGNGSGTIAVTDPFETAIYRLYETSTSQDGVEVRGGKFNVTVTASRSYFITLAYGECESARREVKVTKKESGIVNTITPNADGVNDYWDLSAISDYPKASVNIYSRYGQPVFQSVGYNKPFDGTRNGRELPAGVYYYVIDLKDRNIISGYITIIR